ncbi:MAG TPA: energy-coupling factor transporter transmembrane protein EcfT [Clostridiaceae bacterium]|nr:energy-coupling factor transporter transmembrane protein EcfT [Clostridiaceae bacterium]
MKSRSMLGRSVPGTSLIHRLDARVKFIGAIILMVVMLSARDIRILGFFLLWTVSIMIISQIKIRLIMKSVRPLMFIIIFAMLLHLFTVEGHVLLQLGILKISREGLISGGLTALRLVLMVINTSMFLTLTTTPLAIADALESLLSPLRLLRFPVHEFAMMMSIALRFVPTLLDEADKIMKAQSSRGADYDTGGPLRRIRGLVSILVPLFISSFRRADDLAIAMEARCYRGGTSRTRLHASKLSAIDIVFSFLLLGLLLLVFAVEPLLPPLVWI